MVVSSPFIIADKTAPMTSVQIELGAFRLGRVLGRGGMAVVYEGVHIQQGLPVAVKVLSSSGSDHEAFHREAEAMAGLDHTHIARIFDIGIVDERTADLSSGVLDKDSPYLVMEQLTGGMLNHKSRSRRWRQVADHLLSLLEALGHAHARGVIHRDLKPSNILFGTDEDLSPGLKLVDFGISHAMGKARKGAVESMIAGTPAFMAPEQFTGMWQDYGPWTDLYAFGCLAWQLISGGVPFKEKQSANWIHNMAWAHHEKALPALKPRFRVPTGVEAWLGRLLAKRPEDRFQVAADAARALIELDNDFFGACHAPGLETLGIEATDEAVREGNWTGSWRKVTPGTQMRLEGVGLGVYGLRTLPLVGREEEREVLWAALKSVRQSGRVSAVVLRGAAGVGKSSLARWLCQRVMETGVAQVIQAFHSPLPGATDGLSHMLSRHLRTTGMNAEETTNRIEAALSHLGIVDEHCVSVLTRIAMEVGDESAQSTSPRTRYAAIARLILAMGQKRPVVMWLDDVQWGADALGLALHLIETVDQRSGRLLLVLTARDESLSQGPLEAGLLDGLLGQPEVTPIALGGLPAEDHSALIEQLLHLEGELAEEVNARTAGNPLFAIQLVGDWVQRGVLKVGSTGFVLKDGERARLPDNLHSVWRTHTARMLHGRSPHDRLALGVAAALGQEIDGREWGQACRHAGVVVEANLVTALVSARLARRRPRGWAFVHGMLRESLARQTREAGQNNLVHLACASMIDQLYPNPDCATTARYGRHLMSAGQSERALDALLMAARRRSKAGSCHESMGLLDHYDATLEALHIKGSDPRHGESVLVRMNLFITLGHMLEAKALTHQTVPVARRHKWPSLPELLCFQSLWWKDTRPLKDTLGILEEAMAICAARGDESGQGLAQQRMSLAISKHSPQRALEHAERALAHYRTSDNIMGQCGALDIITHQRRELGQHDAALEACIEAGKLARQLGSALMYGATLNTMGMISLAQNELEKAQAAFRLSRMQLLSIGSAQAAYPLSNLAQAMADQGRFEELTEILAELETELAKLGNPLATANFFVVDMEHAAVCGDVTRWDRRIAYLSALVDSPNELEASTADRLQRAAERIGPLSVARARRALFLARRIYVSLGRDKAVAALEDSLKQTV